MSYRQFEQDLWPPWDGREGVLPLLAGHGLQKDALESEVVDAVQVLYPQAGDRQAINLLGAEHNLRQFPGEYDQAFLARVRQAFEFWGMAGTVQGMLHALEHMGYGVVIRGLEGNIVNGVFQGTADGVQLMQASGGEVAPGTYSLAIDGESFTFDTLVVPDDFTYYAYPPTRIIEHFHESLAIWAEFSLVITPSNSRLNAPAWGGGTRWGDGSLWGMSLKDSEVDRIRAIINEIKPAHARLRAIYLVSAAQPRHWGDSTRWGDGTHWGVGMPTLLWQREGV